MEIASGKTHGLCVPGTYRGALLSSRALGKLGGQEEMQRRRAARLLDGLVEAVCARQACVADGRRIAAGRERISESGPGGLQGIIRASAPNSLAGRAHTCTAVSAETRLFEDPFKLLLFPYTDNFGLRPLS